MRCYNINTVFVNLLWISGHEATLGQFPWHADLTISFYFFVRYCGGSLIDRLWVLTAAHCLKREGNRATHVSIWFGIIDVADASGGVARHSSEFYIHHKYDNVYNDIALIKLNEIVRDTENVHAIMLGNDVYPGFYVETSGFGDAEQGLGARLHYAQLRILRECIRSDGHPVRSSEVCAAPGTGAVCYGDSGSALVTQENRQWKQVGVVEGGTTPGCNFGPVYSFKHYTSSFLLLIICIIYYLALDSRIISGHEATLGDFPWQAYLNIFFNSNDIYSCGGSLIHMRWVLTAAHCLYNNNGDLSTEIDDNDNVHINLIVINLHMSPKNEADILYRLGIRDRGNSGESPCIWKSNVVNLIVEGWGVNIESPCIITTTGTQTFKGLLEQIPGIGYIYFFQISR
ncbi:hypothetical protein RI129_004580 [Pyrocoelia pectoralis]|uniref:Peptidase S1 domain-containing protein n=1 Tax=Pyrocoelia pectoralis TaxID=417401 RepID=A0AAN7ZR20_9COLE